jgi:hypothetical protein
LGISPVLPFHPPKAPSQAKKGAPSGQGYRWKTSNLAVCPVLLLPSQSRVWRETMTPVSKASSRNGAPGLLAKELSELRGDPWLPPAGQPQDCSWARTAFAGPPISPRLETHMPSFCPFRSTWNRGLLRGMVCRMLPSELTYPMAHCPRRVQLGRKM